MSQEIELRIEQNRSPLFKIASNLSGRVYDLKFSWSYRWAAWYLDIDETVKGIKVVNGIDLLESFHYNENIPPGKLGVVRNSGRDSKPFFDNFGIEKAMTLVYEE
jgi:hypothetical protein